jgi:hypothetical protein
MRRLLVEQQALEHVPCADCEQYTGHPRGVSRLGPRRPAAVRRGRPRRSRARRRICVADEVCVRTEALLKTTIPTSRRPGDDHPITLNLRGSCAQARCTDSRTSEEDLVDTVVTCEYCLGIAQLFMGPTHPKHLVW